MKRDKYYLISKHKERVLLLCSDYLSETNHYIDSAKKGDLFYHNTHGVFVFDESYTLIGLINDENRVVGNIINKAGLTEFDSEFRKVLASYNGSGFHKILLWDKETSKPMFLPMLEDSDGIKIHDRFVIFCDDFDDENLLTISESEKLFYLAKTGRVSFQEAKDEILEERKRVRVFEEWIVGIEEIEKDGKRVPLVTESNTIKILSIFEYIPNKNDNGN